MSSDCGRRRIAVKANWMIPHETSFSWSLKKALEKDQRLAKNACLPTTMGDRQNE
jgi:hypothetical protein